MEHMHENKHVINIDAYYENTAAHNGWDKKIFADIVHKLESMNREQLVSLCKHPNIEISFTANEWEEKIPEEEMVLALIADCSPKVLVEAVENLNA